MLCIVQCPPANARTTVKRVGTRRKATMREYITVMLIALMLMMVMAMMVMMLTTIMMMMMMIDDDQ